MAVQCTFTAYVMYVYRSIRAVRKPTTSNTFLRNSAKTSMTGETNMVGQFESSAEKNVSSDCLTRDSPSCNNQGSLP